jgi:hypothetical protein
VLGLQSGDSDCGADIVLLLVFPDPS